MFSHTILPHARATHRVMTQLKRPVSSDAINRAQAVFTNVTSKTTSRLRETINPDEPVTSLAQDSLMPIPRFTDMTQGLASIDPDNELYHNPVVEGVAAGKLAHLSNPQGFDAASNNIKPKPSDVGRGNKEGIGMIEQVGSATATAIFFEEQDRRRAVEAAEEDTTELFSI